MNKISMDSIEKAAKRIAAKHFFSGVETQQDVDNIWEMIEQLMDDENEATERFRNFVYQVWQPFESWELATVFDEVCILHGAIILEMNEGLL